MNQNYEERKERWNRTKQELRTWIAENKSFAKLEPEVQDQLKYIIGRSGIRQSTSSTNDMIRNDFLAKGTLTNMELFEKYEMGKDGMKLFIKSQLTRKDASSWMWVEYDESNKTYTLKGTGAQIPEDYNGWVPTEMREEDI